MKHFIITLLTIVLFASIGMTSTTDIFPETKEFHLRYEPPAYMIEFISQFKGVTHVFKTDKYTLQIWIGDDFKWSEFQFEIESVLAQRGYLGL